MGVIRYWGWSLNLGDFAGSFPLDQPVDEVLGLYQVGLEAKRFCGDAWPRRRPNFGPGSPARLGLAALTKTAGWPTGVVANLAQAWLGAEISPLRPRRIRATEGSSLRLGPGPALTTRPLPGGRGLWQRRPQPGH